MTLEEKISQLETELAKVKAELAERKQSVWLPGDSQKFYYLTGTGFPQEDIFANTLDDNLFKTNNNVFKCDKSTFNHLAWYNDNVIKVQNKLMQLHELLCPDYFPDWSNHCESKFVIYYDTSSKKWFWDAYHSMNMQVVMFTKEAAERACEILNAEKFMIGDDNG